MPLYINLNKHIRKQIEATFPVNIVGEQHVALNLTKKNNKFQ